MICERCDHIQRMPENNEEKFADKPFLRSSREEKRSRAGSQKGE